MAVQGANKSFGEYPMVNRAGPKGRMTCKGPHCYKLYRIRTNKKSTTGDGWSGECETETLCNLRGDEYNSSMFQRIKKR